MAQAFPHGGDNRTINMLDGMDKTAKSWAFKKFSVSASTSATVFGSLMRSIPRCSAIISATFRIKIEAKLLDMSKAFGVFW